MKENRLYKLAGIMLMIGGLFYILIQLIHPTDELSSVETSLYIGVAIMTSIMSLFIFLGILGLYVKQSDHLSVLGHVGAFMFGVFWIISMVFSFIEAFVLPLLVESSTDFVIGMTNLFNNVEVTTNLGVFPNLSVIAGLMYVIGGTLLGIGLYQIKFFSRKRAILLSLASIITLTSGIIPHPYDRGLAFPMGIALIILGDSLVRQRLDKSQFL